MCKLLENAAEPSISKKIHRTRQFVNVIREIVTEVDIPFIGLLYRLFRGPHIPALHAIRDQLRHEEAFILSSDDMFYTDEVD